MESGLYLPIVLARQQDREGDRTSGKKFKSPLLAQKTREKMGHPALAREQTWRNSQSKWQLRPYNHPSMTVTVRSFAKINLGLRIGAAREDGFHDLLTVYQTIGLHDIIRVTVGRGIGIEIRCDDPRVPRDESNTCFRIADRALRALRVKARVTLEIEKRLPVQGGLGGASANAVATLLGLERALQKTLPAAEKFRIIASRRQMLLLRIFGEEAVCDGRSVGGQDGRPVGAVCVRVRPGAAEPRIHALVGGVAAAADGAREPVAGERGP